MPALQTPPGLVTASAAARLLGISSYRMMVIAAAGNVKVVNRPGYPMLFDRASVERYAAGLRPQPSGGKRRPVKAAGK